MYLGGMPDQDVKIDQKSYVKIDQKSYDAGNPQDLARCHHMALVGCGESFSAFRRSLTGGRLKLHHLRGSIWLSRENVSGL
jgi:hypothetical protein